MNVRGARFSVVGAGRSGIAAANLLARRGGDVVLVDASSAPRPVSLDVAVDYRPGGHDVRAGDVMVLSPGITEVSPVRAAVAALAREVLGELELFARLCPEPIHAITGTDGKSTVTTMLGEVFAAAGRTPVVGGNLGVPLCELFDRVAPGTPIVAEVSAFQLTTCTTFRPRTGSVTNLVPDHLDYHGSFERYVAAKHRMSARMGDGDRLVLNADDPHVTAWPVTPGVTTRWYSLRAPADAWYDGHTMWLDGAAWMTRDALSLPGDHNVANTLAVALQATAAGISPDPIRAGVMRYRLLPHRLMLVAEHGGVRWIDDSKATNPHAAAAGIRAVPGPLVLLLGGADKGLPLEELVALVRARARVVIAFGAARARFAAALAGVVDVVSAPGLAAAVAEARRCAISGDAVLLSPACASFDEFSSYASRGEAFAQLIAARASGHDG